MILRQVSFGASGFADCEPGRFSPQLPRSGLVLRLEAVIPD
jgi:hypothetical protein